MHEFRSTTQNFSPAIIELDASNAGCVMTATRTSLHTRDAARSQPIMSVSFPGLYSGPRKVVPGAHTPHRAILTTPIRIRALQCSSRKLH